MTLFTGGRQALEELQKNASEPILVKFIGPHCPACETLAPILEQLIQKHQDQINLVTLDMTEEPELAQAFGVRSAPTVLLFRGQTLVERISGLKPKKIYGELIQRLL